MKTDDLKKKCSICKKVKEVSDFQRDVKGTYGVRAYCKECSKIYARSKDISKIELFKKFEQLQSELAEQKQKNAVLLTKYQVAKANWSTAFQEIAKLKAEISAMSILEDKNFIAF
jgi:hypothetical protein